MTTLPYFVKPHYCNDPKFSDKWVWANRVEQSQTAPEGGLIRAYSVILPASFGPNTVCKTTPFKLQCIGQLQQFFRVADFFY